MIHRSGTHDASVDHRPSKAISAFWAEKDIYCDKSSPLMQRFQRYSTRVVPKVLHGCASWA
eukprot:9918567-Karenia_brevis.AAC.1